MAGILQGTPINTQGIHPLAAIMGQGQDIFGRAFALASNRGAQNNSIAVGFLRDAVQERINTERLALEKRGQDMNFAMQQAQMDQRERLTMAELESRERVAGMRSALSGRQRGAGGPGGGGSYGGAGGVDPQVSAILGSIFQPQGPQAPATPQDLMMQGASAFGEAARGFSNDITGSEFPTVDQTKAEGELNTARTKDLTVPENYDAYESALVKQLDAGKLGVGLSQTRAQLISNVQRAAGYQVDLERYRMEKSKEKGDINGLAMIDGAVKQELSPLDGFTGYKHTSEAQLEEVMKEPTKARAINLLNVGSAQLRKDLASSDPSLDDLSGLLDQYTKASDTVDRQEKAASFLVSDKAQPGSRSYGVSLAKEIVGENPAVAAIRGHKEVLEDAFRDKLKDADLSRLSPSTLSRALFTSMGSKEAAERQVKFQEDRLDQVREQIASLIPDKDAEGKDQDPKNWGWYQLDQAISKEYEDGELTDRGHSLKELKAQWQRAKEGLSKARQNEKKWTMEVGRINNYNRHVGDTVLPPTPDDTLQEDRGDTPAGPVPFDKLKEEFYRNRQQKADALLKPR